jgi:DNA-binding Lrp family transcriptional regulator
MLLDAIDKQLLTLLKADSRKPITLLAQILNISRQTVQKRIDALETAQVITGYTVRTGKGFSSQLFRAQAMLMVESNVGDELVSYLSKIPQVSSTFSVAGHYDAIVTIEADSSEEIDQVLDQIRRHPQVLQTQSCLLLSEKINRAWQS